jgi:hypothetical protein
MFPSIFIFSRIDNRAYRVVGYLTRKFSIFSVNTIFSASTIFSYQRRNVGGYVKPDYGESGLDGIYDSFFGCARHYKINVVLILVYVIPDYMLNVFRNNIHIVYNHGFLFYRIWTIRLTKRF